MTKPIVAAFDFDGTITTSDTFLPFLFRAFGRTKVYLVLISLAWPGLKVFLGAATRDYYKALLIGRLFPSAPVDFLLNAGKQDAIQIESILRPAALARIAWHKHAGHRLIMVSASLNYYLAPIAEKLGFDDLLCTEVDSTDGVCSGMKGNNCRAAEKVRRLEGLLGPLSQYEIFAYGDSDGDTEMLTVADHPAFQPFHV